MTGRSKDPRRTHAWRKVAAKVLARADACALCGLPLVPDAPPRSRWSSSVDHIVPVSAGGPWFDEHNLRASHYGCNSRKGGVKTRPATPTTTTIYTRSRNW